MSKERFIKECGILFNCAESYFQKFELIKGSDLSSDRYIDNDDYVLVYCKDGLQYAIHINPNSITRIDIINDIANGIKSIRIQR